MAEAHQSPPRSQHLQALLLALLCAALFLRDALLPGHALVPYPPEQMDVVRAEAIANGTFDPVDARRGNTSSATHRRLRSEPRCLRSHQKISVVTGFVAWNPV